MLWKFINHLSNRRIEIASQEMDKSKDLSSRQKLIRQIYHLDREAYSACINFLSEKYPQLSNEQAQKLISFIFDNNFKARLPNHFGKNYHGSEFGYPFIWLLNQLESGGIQYLYQNGIWQIHWDAGDRYEGIIRRDRRKVIKYLLTAGPIDEEGQRLWEKHNLIFYSYSIPTFSRWEYPFPEDADLSSDNEYLIRLNPWLDKAAAQAQLSV